MQPAKRALAHTIDSHYKTGDIAATLESNAEKSALWQVASLSAARAKT